MAKEFIVLSTDSARGCMLVRFTDGLASHETEVPLPPVLPAGSGDADAAEWIRRFWPHSQIEVQKNGPEAAVTAIVGKVIDVTSKIPTPRDSVGGRFPIDPDPDPGA